MRGRGVYAAVGSEEVSLAEGMLAQTQNAATKPHADDSEEDDTGVVEEDQNAQLSQVRCQKPTYTFAVHMGT